MINSVSELLDKISLGEDSTIGFKQELTNWNRNSFADEIAAFANSFGGVIVVGVSDNRNIVGIPSGKADKVENIAVEVGKDSISPSVRTITEIIRIDDKLILKVEVPRSLFIHKSPSGYLMRQGSSRMEFPPDLLIRLSQERSQGRNIPFDRQAVPLTQFYNLNEQLYRRFIYFSEQEPIESVLMKRHLLVKERGDIRATVAGVLMCCESPEEFIPNGYICAVHYGGIYKDANYQVDAKDIYGPLDKQVLDALSFVMTNSLVSAKKSTLREDLPQYSMRAIFEAIVNAVVHRDYSKHGAKIRLFMFSDRLEIYSPGGLVDSLTIDGLIYNQCARNELLTRLLSEVKLNNTVSNQIARSGFMDRRGEGVGIIIRESKELSGVEPKYELKGDELCLTIYPASPTE